MTEDTLDTPQLECPDCHRTFKTTSALREHSRTHSVDEHVERTLQPVPAPFDQVYAATGTPVQMPTGTVHTGTISHASAAPPEVVVKVKKLKHYGKLPDIKRATVGSAGIDLYAAISQEVPLRINHWELIPTGLAIEVPPGWVAKIVPRSGLAANFGITVLNTPGIIDSDYRGEIKINLINNTNSKFRVTPGMRIAQMLIERAPTVHLEFVDELSETVRGTGGFGSTGI